MDVLRHLARAHLGGRASRGPVPSPEQLDQLARAVADGRYRVPVEQVAEALLKGPRARRG